MTRGVPEVTPAPEDFVEGFPEWQTLGLAGLTWMSPRMAQQLVDMQIELVRFAARRAEACARARAECLGAKDPVEFRDAWGRYLRSAFEQYCAETGTLVRMNRAAFDGSTGRGTADG